MGVYYTSTRLARFLAESVIEETLAEEENVQDALQRVGTAKNAQEMEKAVDELFSNLQNIRVLDFACGSGIFLTSALSALLRPLRGALEALRSTQYDLVDLLKIVEHQANLLKATIYGVDCLPQVVELAKLALWLTAARLNEPAADLSPNILVGDSFSPAIAAAHQKVAPAGYDVVLGNPPWGGTYDRALAEAVLQSPEIDLAAISDSWEAFLALAWLHLKPGGRLARNSHRG